MPTIYEYRTLIRGCPATQTGGECNITETCDGFGDCWNESCVGCEWKRGPGPKGRYWPEALEGEGWWYWSRTLVPEDEQYGWFVGFDHGYITNLEVIVAPNMYVRCVRDAGKNM